MFRVWVHIPRAPAAQAQNCVRRRKKRRFISEKVAKFCPSRGAHLHKGARASCSAYTHKTGPTPTRRVCVLRAPRVDEKYLLLGLHFFRRRLVVHVEGN